MGISFRQNVRSIFNGGKRALHLHHRGSSVEGINGSRVEYVLNHSATDLLRIRRKGKRTLLPECLLLFLAHIGWGPRLYWTPYWHATLPVSRSAPAYYVEYIALRGL